MAKSRGEYPSALLKALDNEFDVALQLRNGTLIRCWSVEMDALGEWLHLSGIESVSWSDGDAASWSFPHGMEVRFEDISWIADAPDAPEGS